MSTTKTPTAPRSLGADGRKLWRAVTTMAVEGRRIEFRTDELTVLAQAAATADAIAALEAELVGARVVVAGSKGQTIVNPVVIELRLQRAALATLLGRLAIPDASSSWEGLTSSQRARRAAHARWA